MPRSARLEAVRAIAALAVFGCHAWAQVHGFTFETFGRRVVLGGGLYGVYAFFALSGYLLYLPFARGEVDLRRYARNRALRILPLYYVVLAVVLVVNGAGPGVALRFLTFTQNFDEALVAKAVNGPMWSLVVELHFYLLLPFLAWGLARLGSRRRAAAVLVGLGLAACVVDAVDPAPPDVWTYNLPSTFQFFVPGMLLAMVQASAPSWPASGRWWARADVWLAASVPVWLLVFWDYALSPLATVACFLLVGAAALPLRRGRLDRFLEWRALSLVGLVSYGLYLWHVPVLHWVRGTGGGVWGVAAAGLAASLVLAAVTWHLVEAPAMRLRERRLLPAGWRPWALVGLGALAVRAAVAVAAWPLSPGADAADYHRLGRLLASTGSWGESVLAAGGGPTAFRPPLYPAFLAGVYRATAGSVAAAVAAQVVLGAVTAVLVGVLAARLWDRRAGLVAGGLAAVFPPLVAASVAPMSESLFLPLVVGALVCGLEARARLAPASSSWWVAAAGASCGLAVLARPAGAVLVPVVALLVIGWRRAVGVAAVAAMVVVPWSVAASVRLGAFVPVSTIDGFNLAGVYAESVAGDPSAPGVWRPPVAVPEHARLFEDPSLGEAELASALRSAGIEHALAHPAYVAEVVARSTLRLLDLDGPGLTADVYRADYSFDAGWLATSSFWSWWAVAPLAAVGLVRGAWRRVPRPLLVAPALLWAVTVPVLGHARLRAPIDVFVVLAAAFAVASFLPRRRPPIEVRGRIVGREAPTDDGGPTWQDANPRRADVRPQLPSGGEVPERRSRP